MANQAQRPLASHAVLIEGMDVTESHPTIAGEVVTIRPIRVADAEMEAEFIRRLSPQTKHYRFFGGVKELSPSEVAQLCEVDGRHSMAFVATIRRGGRETEIGVSRYAPNSRSDQMIYSLQL